MKLIKEGVGVTIKVVYGERGGLVVFLDESASGVNHENDVFLKRLVKGWIMEVRDARIPSHWSVFLHLHWNREHSLLLDDQFARTDVVYLGRSKVGYKEI